MTVIANIPVHITPSPVQPGRQLQICDPGMLTQSAFILHGLGVA